MWLLFGVSALIVALALGWLLLRLGRTLTTVEELLETTTEGLQETLPEMRQTLGNVNDITAGVNTGLGVAARGASLAGDGVKRLFTASLAYMDGSGGTETAQEAPRARPVRRRGGAAGGQ